MTTFFIRVFLSLIAFSNAESLIVQKPVEFQNWDQFVDKSNSSDEFKENPHKYSGKDATKVWLSLEPLRILSIDLDEQV